MGRAVEPACGIRFRTRAHLRVEPGPRHALGHWQLHLDAVGVLQVLRKLEQESCFDLLHGSGTFAHAVNVS